MTTYRIVSAAVVSAVASLVLSTVEGLEAGVCIRVYKTGEQRLDQRHNIATVNEETKTITFAAAGPNITLFNPPNASVVPLTTWVDDADVELFLGLPAAGTDADYLAQVVEAGNDWAYRRRQAAGYSDSRCLIPAPSVKEGTVLYCAALYRERGSVDSFSSFSDTPIVGSVGTMGQIMRLLGINRPAVG
jgi:hypothetical protein